MTGAEHRVRGSGSWTFWRWLWFRGAGFPAKNVLALAVNDAAPLVEAHVEELLRLEAARTEATARCREALSAGDSMKEMRKALKALKRQRVPEEVLDPTVQAAIARVRDIALASARAEATLRSHLEEQEPEVTRRLRAAATEPSVVHAITWQNRSLVRHSILSSDAWNANNFRRRQLEQLAARYLQRYCTKNDTIGFFGPMAFGTFEPTGPAVTIRSGPALIRDGRVYFEHWAIDALAEKLSNDPTVRMWSSPRLTPALWLDGRVLHMPNGRRVEMDEAHGRILRACDGHRTVPDIAAVTGDGEHEVRRALMELAAKSFIRWSLEAPVENVRPESSLRRAIDRIGDSSARTRAGTALAELERLRKGIEDADRASLEPAIAHLESRFRELTGAEANRNAGETYGSRTLVYLDCRRDLELELGPALLDRIGKALDLLLLSARWLTYDVACRFREWVGAALGEHERIIDLVALLERMKAGVGEALVDSAVLELQRRWATLLPSSEAPIHSADIASEVERLFAAPGPGWPMARYHCPDIALAAPSVAAINRGEYTAIISEIHVGANMMFSMCAFEQHPEPDALLRAYELDVPMPRIAPVLAKSRVHRAEPRCPSIKDFHVEIGSSMSWRPRDHVRAAADFVVERRPDGVVVRTRSGDLSFDLATFFEDYLTAHTLNRFAIVAPAARRHSITIDSLVVSRASWTFDAADLPFIEKTDRTDRLLTALTWARRHALPRFMFARVPEEKKPLYVDMASPIIVENLAKAIKSGGAVTFSEMAPGHDELWLTDAAGDRFTSELRLVAVDPIEYRSTTAP